MDVVRIAIVRKIKASIVRRRRRRRSVKVVSVRKVVENSLLIFINFVKYAN